MESITLHPCVPRRQCTTPGCGETFVFRRSARQKQFRADSC